MRILLADGQTLFCAGLAALLNAESDISVAGQASTVRDALALARRVKPDLVLSELQFADGCGLDMVRQMLDQRAAGQAAFLTGNVAGDDVGAAIRAGARGYLLKSTSAPRLLDALRELAQGNPAFCPEALELMLGQLAVRPAHPAVEHDCRDLTARELEVLRYLAQNATNHEIAARLVISENTVKNHVSSILAKLQVRSRDEAAHVGRNGGYGFSAQ